MKYTISKVRVLSENAFWNTFHNTRLSEIERKRIHSFQPAFLDDSSCVRAIIIIGAGVNHSISWTCNNNNNNNNNSNNNTTPWPRWHSKRPQALTVILSWPWRSHPQTISSPLEQCGKQVGTPKSSYTSFDQTDDSALRIRNVWQSFSAMLVCHYQTTFSIKSHQINLFTWLNCWRLSHRTHQKKTNKQTNKQMPRTTTNQHQPTNQPDKQTSNENKWLLYLKEAIVAMNVNQTCNLYSISVYQYINWLSRNWKNIFKNTPQKRLCKDATHVQPLNSQGSLPILGAADGAHQPQAVEPYQGLDASVLWLQQ